MMVKMKSPSNLFYTKEHLWVELTPEGDWLVGITDYAQDLLGDIVYLELPQLNASIRNGTPCGIVESVKTGSDLHAPMDGVVIAINDAILDAPDAINDAPYKSWLFKFEPSNSDDKGHFLTADAYDTLVSED